MGMDLRWWRHGAREECSAGGEHERDDCVVLPLKHSEACCRSLQILRREG